MVLRFISLSGRIVPVGFFVFGALLGWAGSNLMEDGALLYRGAVLRQDDSHYQYIAPLLACEIGSKDAFPELEDLEEDLKSTIAEHKKSNNVISASVYIRSLRGGRWLAVNEDEKYVPASLMKVFLMMAYFKETDESDNPALLKRKILYTIYEDDPEDALQRDIPKLVAGRAYTAEELIEQMIVHSDNSAAQSLAIAMSEEATNNFKELFDLFNIPFPKFNNESELRYMTVDHYALSFRVLFGATYLSRNYSERALALLTETDFDAGIVARMPKQLVIAHKFGVATAQETGDRKSGRELHDCGIVYYPEHPYLICVMTHGASYEGLSKAVQGISRTAYDWLHDFYQANPASPSVSTFEY